MLGPRHPAFGTVFVRACRCNALQNCSSDPACLLLTSSPPLPPPTSPPPTLPPTIHPRPNSHHHAPLQPHPNSYLWTGGACWSSSDYSKHRDLSCTSQPAYVACVC